MEIKVLLVLIISGIFTFLLLSSLIIPFFAETYEYGFGTEPCAKTNSCNGATDSLINPNCATGSTSLVTCTNCNISTGYATFLTTCYKLRNGTDPRNQCESCTAFNGYKTSVTGLMLFVFFMIVITIIIVLIKTFKGRK
jgi:hypothetical protein